VNHLDLFSGIGGFALAAEWAGFKTVGFVECDPFCRKVLKKHWPNVPISLDIRTMSVSKDIKINLLTGGFPCQPFSTAGNQRGENDDRYLWPEMLRIIRECKPSWIIAENVSGIIPMLDPILESLEREAYTWQAYLIPASSIGAPHKRERVWIIAHANRERRDHGADSRKGRYVQDNFDRYFEKIYKEWSQYIPQSWETFNTRFTTDSNSVSSIQKNSDIEKNKASWQRHTRTDISSRFRIDPEEDESPIPGVDDGLPDIVDRNKALGNAIVPQVIYPIMKLIAEMEQDA